MSSDTCPLFAVADSDEGAGEVQGPHQGDDHRQAAQRQRDARARQVQDAQTDPTGQHQAKSRHVRGSLTGLFSAGGRASCYTVCYDRPADPPEHSSQRPIAFWSDRGENCRGRR